MPSRPRREREVQLAALNAAEDAWVDSWVRYCPCDAISAHTGNINGLHGTGYQKINQRSYVSLRSGAVLSGRQLDWFSK